MYPKGFKTVVAYILILPIILGILADIKVFGCMQAFIAALQFSAP